MDLVTGMRFWWKTRSKISKETDPYAMDRKDKTYKADLAFSVE